VKHKLLIRNIQLLPSRKMAIIFLLAVFHLFLRTSLAAGLSCYHYTESDRKRIQNGEREEEVCQSHGHLFNSGKLPNCWNSESQTCWCCKRADKNQEPYGQLGRHRIVGGHEVTPKYSRPYMAYLIFKPGLTHLNRCGGSILTEFHILTAAHCVVSDVMREYIVVVGEHDITKVEGPEQELMIESKYIHPKKYETNKRYDFAILKLKNPITFNSKVSAISLPDAGDTEFDKKGKPFVSMGWGDQVHGGHGSDVLREVELPWVTKEECKEAYEGRPDCILNPCIIDETEICAGDLVNGGVDSCQWDSGGPLVWYDKESKKWKLIGVVSRGMGCGEPGQPGVYGKVTFVLDWIKEIIRK